jgi:hypothetical protein
MLRLMEQRIFDAVQTLTAQVLTAGGRLVHGGHPTITNAIAAQTGNWTVARAPISSLETTSKIQPPVVLYQSEFFAHLPPPPGREEMVRTGVAVVRWTPSTLDNAQVKGEPLLRRFQLQPEWIKAWLPGQAPASASDDLREALLTLRLVMLLESQPRAAVSIGGMEGIEAEARLFLDLREHHLLKGEGGVNVLASTFGAAAQLDDKRVRLVEDLTEQGAHRPITLPSDGQASSTHHVMERVCYEDVFYKLIQKIRQDSNPDRKES